MPRLKPTAKYILNQAIDPDVCRAKKGPDYESVHCNLAPHTNGLHYDDYLGIWWEEATDSPFMKTTSATVDGASGSTI